MTTVNRQGGSTVFAAGLAMFAGLMMIANGLFHVFSGIVAIADDSFYVQTPDYTFDVDITAWGWTNIIVGIVIGLVGLGVMTGNLFARVLGAIVIVFVMVDNFLFIPHYPLWGIVLVGFDALILWAIVTAP